jgi:hypothetical protein
MYVILLFDEPTWTQILSAIVRRRPRARHSGFDNRWLAGMPGVGRFAARSERTRVGRLAGVVRTAISEVGGKHSDSLSAIADGFSVPGRAAHKSCHSVAGPDQAARASHSSRLVEFSGAVARRSAHHQGDAKFEIWTNTDKAVMDLPGHGHAENTGKQGLFDDWTARSRNR